MSRRRVLLDTHVLIWLLHDPAKLSARHRKALADDPLLVVSAVSMWEIALKTALNRLIIEADLLETVRQHDAEWLSITPEHAAAVATIPRLHGDPFDRLLVAQATCESLPLMTSDRLMRGYDVALI